MAFRLSVRWVLLVAVTAISVNGLSDGPAGEEVKGSNLKIPKSINHEGKLAQNLIHHEDHHSPNHKFRDSLEEVPTSNSRVDTLDDPTFDYNETSFDSSPDKPSKFDRDITDLIHTDLKSMHDSEAARLKADSENGSASFENHAMNSTRRSDVPEIEDEDDVEQSCNSTVSLACLEQNLEENLDYLVDAMSTIDVYNVTNFAQIVRNASAPENDVVNSDLSAIEKLSRYAKEHILRLKMPDDFSLARGSRTFFGAIFQDKSSFLTGFGLGFLAFGLKKLMLPLFVGMQIIKGVIVALFLPSILGGIGKIFGKGLSTFSQVSQAATAQPEETFEFKDNADIYNEDYMHNQPIGTLPASAMYGQQSMLNIGDQYPAASSGVSANQRISYVNSLSDNYYSRNSMLGANKRQDYKVFHEIPTSSLLLTNYDPFYSPLLSRLDAVFSRLGHSTEGCREYAICAMYKSPARYAPYSNLVSAQLSRELNELRKPTSDNPDVLRFFKYMKAAKDGQDGVQCEDIYTECASRGNPTGQNEAMLATYQDINKLVQARKI
ncbi:uncharacterized protein LOC105685692 isoform X1 [Athalia rosae]|uniref:uncharacterized protein LOC105685692 isoform X1 n=1 Tax=Athalia rosae TaxID=37344 RepID=UPI002033FC51|nr:uncharacterized protein LOC105685692 isoform X1 [Athalia rosae]